MHITAQQVQDFCTGTRQPGEDASPYVRLANKINAFFSDVANPWRAHAVEERVCISLAADPSVQQFFSTLDDRLTIVEGQIAMLSAD